MAHEIQENDNMFSVRQLPWHGLGKVIEEYPDSISALAQAGLDWRIEQKSVHLLNGKLIPDYYANVRSDTQETLGMVTGRYSIIQNSEAFSFTDALVGSGDVRYETAGSLQNGKKVWMLAKLNGHEGFNLVGDTTEIYLCFSNTHDGSGAVRVMVTPIRVVCQNTLNLAYKKAVRSWSVTHVGEVAAKMKEAERTLKNTGIYMASLQEQADLLSQKKVGKKKMTDLLDQLFPYEAQATARQRATIDQKREGVLRALAAPDIARFQGTGYALINAVSDYVGHSEPMRTTETFYANRFDKLVMGHKTLDTAVELVLAS